MSFSTAWCANALSICASTGLGAKIDRIEVSRRFLLRAAQPLTPAERDAFAALVHDRMTEQVRDGWSSRRRAACLQQAGWRLGRLRLQAALQACMLPTPSWPPVRPSTRHVPLTPRSHSPQVYPEPLRSFKTDTVPSPVITIPVVAEGRAALERINKARGALRRARGCGVWGRQRRAADGEGQAAEGS